jgi:flagellar biosynthetic protein FliR
MQPLNIDIPVVQFELFLMIFFRISAMLMTIPFFSSKNIPILFKVGLAVSMSMFMTPHLQALPVILTEDIWMLALRLVGEVTIGIIIGLTLQMIFSGVQMAGQLVGFQMSFAIANVVDPAGEAQVPLLSQFSHVLAMLLFLATNAHHLLLRTLVESFHLIPPLSFHYRQALVQEVMKLAGNMFLVSIKLGAPVMIVLLLTSVAMGLMARTVPQMHVFIVAMPLKIAIGFIFLGLTMPYMSTFLEQLFAANATDIITLLNLCQESR